ncbi:MAG: hypothetical protein ACRERX_05950 [Pseudomonas sp.]
MFSFFKTFFASSRATDIDARAGYTVEAESPVGGFALVYACISGWFNTETGELLQGFPIRSEVTALGVVVWGGIFYPQLRQDENRGYFFEHKSGTSSTKACAGQTAAKEPSHHRPQALKAGKHSIMRVLTC